MAVQYDNTNRGAIFRNERKEKDSQPDYRGPLNIKGDEGEIACWVKEKNGQKFFSCKWQSKDDKPQSGGQGRDHQAPLDDDELNDSVPF